MAPKTVLHQCMPLKMIRMNGIHFNGGREVHWTFDQFVRSLVKYSRTKNRREWWIPVLQPGLITQANGSAYIETEHTKIACAVSVFRKISCGPRRKPDQLISYGPRQSKNVSYSESGHLNVEVKFAPFSCRRRRAPLRVSAERKVWHNHKQTEARRMPKIEQLQ